MNQQRDPLWDLPTNHPIKTGSEICIDEHPKSLFWCIDDRDPHWATVQVEPRRGPEVTVRNRSYHSSRDEMV